MRALVVFESMFGNGRAIATAIGAGLATDTSVRVVAVDDAPTVLPPDIDLLVVGGPNHRFGMTTDDSRREAAAQAAVPADATRRGLRSWLGSLDARQSSAVAAVYDTRLASPRFLDRVDHASRSIERTLRRTGVRLVVPAEHFYVAAMAGPLVDGELDRAHQWGATLGATMRRSARA